VRLDHLLSREIRRIVRSLLTETDLNSKKSFITVKKRWKDREMQVSYHSSVAKVSSSGL
jgi:hypothetical protein